MATQAIPLTETPVTEFDRLDNFVGDEGGLTGHNTFGYLLNLTHSIFVKHIKIESDIGPTHADGTIHLDPFIDYRAVAVIVHTKSLTLPAGGPVIFSVDNEVGDAWRNNVPSVNFPPPALFQTLPDIDKIGGAVTTNAGKVRITKVGHQVQTGDIIRITNNSVYFVDAVATRTSADIIDLAAIDFVSNQIVDFHIIAHGITSFASAGVNLLTVNSLAHGRVAGDYIQINDPTATRPYQNPPTHKIVSATTNAFVIGVGFISPSVATSTWSVGLGFIGFRSMATVDNNLNPKISSTARKLFNIAGNPKGSSAFSATALAVLGYQFYGLIKDVERDFGISQSLFNAVKLEEGLILENCRLINMQNSFFESDINSDSKTNALTITGKTPFSVLLQDITHKLKANEYLLNFDDSLATTSKVKVTAVEVETTPANFFAAASLGRCDGTPTNSSGVVLKNVRKYSDKWAVGNTLILRESTKYNAATGAITSFSGADVHTNITFVAPISLTNCIENVITQIGSLTTLNLMLAMQQH